ncbi:hypothetical protein V865_002061 [Kwoniella europaea PYCC6329]|uniref:Uncharacterized protein n=1 Tax=Kwoniella europaea PYCC6329 TaxID=1423913 RepID=A0AAX4KCV3_9TREE
MIGSQTFRPNDAPRYLHGLMASAILMAAELVWLCVWWYYYRWTNTKRDAGAAAAGLTQEEIDHANRLAGETDQTDLRESTRPVMEASNTDMVLTLTDCEQKTPVLDIVWRNLSQGAEYLY